MEEKKETIIGDMCDRSKLWANMFVMLLKYGHEGTGQDVDIEYYQSQGGHDWTRKKEPSGTIVQQGASN